MKVGTDSILLGSWVEPGKAKHILDIGAGSGLLALMMAQKTADSTRIDAIELDEGAVSQAQDNFRFSPWVGKLNIERGDINHFQPSHDYDLIISNPPYFPAANQTPTGLASESPQTNRQFARHTHTLSFAALAKNVNRLMSSDGRFYCVLPTSCADILIQACLKLSIFCCEQVAVYTRTGAEAKRCLLGFQRQKLAKQQTSVVIYEHNQSYSTQYKGICQAFYLNF